MIPNNPGTRDAPGNENLIETLIAISVVARHLAATLAKQTKGGSTNETKRPDHRH